MKKNRKRRRRNDGDDDGICIEVPEVNIPIEVNPYTDCSKGKIRLKEAIPIKRNPALVPPERIIERDVPIDDLQYAFIDGFEIYAKDSMGKLYKVTTEYWTDWNEMPEGWQFESHAVRKFMLPIAAEHWKELEWQMTSNEEQQNLQRRKLRSGIVQKTLKEILEKPALPRGASYRELGHKSYIGVLPETNKATVFTSVDVPTGKTHPMFGYCIGPYRIVEDALVDIPKQNLVLLSGASQRKVMSGKYSAGYLKEMELNPNYGKRFFGAYGRAAKLCSCGMDQDDCDEMFEQIKERCCDKCIHRMKRNPYFKGSYYRQEYHPTVASIFDKEILKSHGEGVIKAFERTKLTRTEDGRIVSGGVISTMESVQGKENVITFIKKYITYIIENYITNKIGSVCQIELIEDSMGVKEIEGGLFKVWGIFRVGFRDGSKSAGSFTVDGTGNWDSFLARSLKVY